MDHREEHHVSTTGPAGTRKEDVSIKQQGCGTEQSHQKTEIRQDIPGGMGTRHVEEKVTTGDKDEGLLSKAARKVGLKD